MVYFSKWKISIILGIVLLGFVVAAPNLLEQKTAGDLPTWLPNQQVNLGLDLQGGSHLLLEVKVSVVVRERLEVLLMRLGWFYVKTVSGIQGLVFGILLLVFR